MKSRDVKLNDSESFLSQERDLIGNKNTVQGLQLDRFAYLPAHGTLGLKPPKVSQTTVPAA